MRIQLNEKGSDLCKFQQLKKKQKQQTSCHRLWLYSLSVPINFVWPACQTNPCKAERRHMVSRSPQSHLRNISRCRMCGIVTGLTRPFIYLFIFIFFFLGAIILLFSKRRWLCGSDIKYSQAYLTVNKTYTACRTTEIISQIESLELKGCAVGVICQQTGFQPGQLVYARLIL